MVLHFLRNWKVVNNLTCLLDRNPTNYFVYLTGGLLLLSPCDLGSLRKFLQFLHLDQDCKKIRLP